MKITIEPTNPPAGADFECVNHTVTVEHPYDDITAEQLVSLFSDAAIAFGFNVELIDPLLTR